MFMGFSITSAVLGGNIVLIYGISASFGPTAITLIILTLGIIEFAIGIWAAVCLCLMKPCTCCASSPQQVSRHPRVTRVLMGKWRLCPTDIWVFIRRTVQ